MAKQPAKAAFDLSGYRSAPSIGRPNMRRMLRTGGPRAPGLTLAPSAKVFQSPDMTAWAVFSRFRRWGILVPSPIIFFQAFSQPFLDPFSKIFSFFQSGNQRFRHSLLCDTFCFGDFALCFPFDAILPESVKLCPSQYASDSRNRCLRITNLSFSDLPFRCQSLLIGNSKGGFRNHAHRCGVVAFLHIAFVLYVKDLVRPPLPTAKLCFIGEISAGQADQISIGVAHRAQKKPTATPLWA